MNKTSYMDRFEFMLLTTEFVVEATHNEQQMLWEKFCKDSLEPAKRAVLEWKQLNPGYSETVGYVGEHPVCICVFWVLINGAQVMFYEPTSRIVDHEMIEKWLDANCNRKWNGGRRAHTNAENFHLVLDFLRETGRGPVWHEYDPS